MNPSGPDDRPPAIVEPRPDGARGSEVTERALHLRIRQQEILAELGVLALQGTPFEKLLHETARLVAEGLQAEYCKVLEYVPAQNRLHVRAGVGWGDGVVGNASVGADLESPAGFALRTGKPVISNHLENEERFRTPELLVEHGIRRAMNVILQGDGAPFGVLEVDSQSEGEFAEHDIAFLQGAANVLGMAIERQRQERSLKSALARHEVLHKEIHHRVKNGLQLVSALLNHQARSAGDPEVARHLVEASRRVSTIGRANDYLAHATDIERIDLDAYLGQVCKDVDIGLSAAEVVVEAESGLRMAQDRAILLALIVNELVTNAVKYAYPGQAGGRIVLEISRASPDTIIVSVRDDGIGVPPDFDPAASKGLGMRIVRTLADQLGASFTHRRRDPGTEFALHVRLAPEGAQIAPESGPSPRA